MRNFLDSVRGQCADLDPALLELHFRRLPSAYFDRHSAADIARHLRLIAGLTRDKPVEVEIRALAHQAFEMVVVGTDHTGTLACITAAVASLGFNLEDVQVASYLATEPDPQTTEPNYFVVWLRMSGRPQGLLLLELANHLRTRLAEVFGHLVEGRLVEAQSVAADVRPGATDGLPPMTTRLTKPAAPPPAVEDMLLGGDFRLQRKLAVGGMSDVHLATQESLNRTVAVKLFRQQASADKDLLARFCQEGVVLAQFNCSSIVQILAAGTVPGQAAGLVGWMAMEFMAGGDLARWQREHGCPPLELAAQWFREALEGLHYAHRHSILHRDIKPHNLLLTAEGHLKVSDFGLLKQIQQPAAGLTPDSAVMGTPHYMSPEQALGEALDERSDIFSLGTTFFFLLSGRLPFSKKNSAAVLVQIAQEKAPRLLEVAPEAPAPLAVLIDRMMARNREERYQEVEVILEDLASYSRRGLLKSMDPGPGFFFPMLSPETPLEETQVYRAPPEMESGTS